MSSLDKMSEYFKALSDPTRLKLLHRLNTCECALCVTAMAKYLEVSQSAVSQHLRVLRQVGLVVSERRGYFIHYSLNRNEFQKISQLLQQLSAKKEK